MSKYLADLERATPGLSERLWKLHARSCTSDTDNQIAAVLTSHAKVQGMDITINGGAWKEHRARLGLISRQIHRTTPPTQPNVNGDADAQLELHTPMASPTDLLANKIEALRYAIEHLTRVIEAQAQPNHHSILEAVEFGRP